MCCFVRMATALVPHRKPTNVQETRVCGDRPGDYGGNLVRDGVAGGDALKRQKPRTLRGSDGVHLTLGIVAGLSDAGQLVRIAYRFDSGRGGAVVYDGHQFAKLVKLNHGVGTNLPIGSGVDVLGVDDLLAYGKQYVVERIAVNQA